MRLDDDVIAVCPDSRGRADVDALVATRLLRSAMGADRGLVLEKFRFLELTDRAGNVGNSIGLGASIRAGAPVPLGRLMHGKARQLVEIEHEIEVLATRLPGAVEIDGAYRAAGLHA